MAQPEEKYCPRCQQPFHCNAEDISACGCSAVILSPEARHYLATEFQDCLCVNCLEEIGKQFSFSEKQR